MIRIRYKKDPDTGMLFSKPMLGGTVMHVVTIDPTYPRFIITCYDNGKVELEGGSSSLAKTKALAKAKLREMGVNFDDEIRRRGNEEACPATPGVQPEDSEIPF
jgi:hypothetical protein